jgi:hypothetical protein
LGHFSAMKPKNGSLEVAPLYHTVGLVKGGERRVAREAL